MITTKLLADSGKAGIVLTAVLLVTLAGCGRGSDAPISVVQAPAAVAAQAPAAAPAVLPPDDYVYYPTYGIYYGNNRHQYSYQHGGAWVSEPAPGGVGVDELRASPSVKMDFHDAPGNHHEAIARQYPKDWKPSARN